MIGAIENAMICAVKAASGEALGYTIRKVDSYGGDFADGLERIVRDFPAVLFVQNGITLMRASQTLIKVKAVWSVLCCANSLRNEKAARDGAAGGVGSYQLVEDMIATLCNQDFGLAIEPFVFQEVNPLVNDKADRQLASIYGLKVWTVYSIDVMANGGSLGDFDTFHANWDFPPVTDAEKTIPSDDTAFATDNVTNPNEE